MDPLDNPYRPGAGSPPPALMGRNRLIDSFGIMARRALSGQPGKSMVPIGLRGVGKTVLLNRFREIAEQEGFQVAAIEAPETGDFGMLLTVWLRKVLMRIDRSGGTKAVMHAMGVLKAFSLNLPDGASVSLNVAAIGGEADSGLLAEDLTDLLVAVGEAARSKQTGVLLAIDEVQYLTAEEFGALITAIHRTTQLNLPVVLVGAGLPQLPGLAGDAKSYAERLFDFPVMGDLGSEDAREALAIPAAEKDVEFGDDALDLVLKEAGGYPYFLQEWGSHVWNQAAGSPITAADVTAVRARVMDQLDRNFFLVRFDRLTPKEKEYLRGMAELGPGPHRSGDIAAQLGVTVESVAPRRKQLIGKGMIYSPSHGETAFTVPLFDSFLRRAMPLAGGEAEAANETEMEN